MKNRIAASANRARVTLLWVALAIAVVGAIIGLGIGAKNMIAEESSQAHALVGDGERALAKNDRATAVLDFERARLIAPRSDFVRSAITATDVKDAEPAAVRAARLVSAREWTAIVVTSGWISALGFVLLILRSSSRFGSRLAFAAGGVFIVGMAATGVISSASAIAVVMSADQHLLVAPYVNATSEASLPCGAVVVVGSAYQGFVQVREADGANGWVPSSSIKFIANQNQDG
jgi:hypothetical protein